MTSPEEALLTSKCPCPLFFRSDTAPFLIIKIDRDGSPSEKRVSPALKVRGVVDIGSFNAAKLEEMTQ